MAKVTTSGPTKRSRPDGEQGEDSTVTSDSSEAEVVSSKVLFLRKGYMLEVSSWENDMDAFNTETKTYTTLEQAQGMRDLALLCSRKNPNSIGNEQEAKKAWPIVMNFMRTHRSLYAKYAVEIENDEDALWDHFGELMAEIMGRSEHYIARVCESVKLYQVPEDVYLTLLE